MGPADEDTNKRAAPHHYVLAHIALRQVCQVNPLGFFGVMASDKRQEFLDHIWQGVCDECDAYGRASFSLSDVSVATSRIGGYPAVIVRMPQPEEVTQAHLVAIVLKVSADDAGDPAAKAEVCYFTLEKGRNMDGSERTVLCGWSMEGAHLNYGDGPPVDEEAFITAVQARL